MAKGLVGVLDIEMHGVKQTSANPGLAVSLGPSETPRHHFACSQEVLPWLPEDSYFPEINSPILETRHAFLGGTSSSKLLNCTKTLLSNEAIGMAA